MKIMTANSTNVSVVR